MFGILLEAMNGKICGIIVSTLYYVISNSVHIKLRQLRIFPSRHHGCEKLKQISAKWNHISLQMFVRPYGLVFKEK